MTCLYLSPALVPALAIAGSARLLKRPSYCHTVLYLEDYSTEVCSLRSAL